ncbi:MAG: pantoate--beta-alanine ligase [Candidatus Diapherotrites archaeon]|uniref:pantoate--beta-alanine ligase (AMP-forming) n=1 Tax=Candidatus Iainarchaeum sp. TaxID=3101447 RepID=A0A2D6M0A9_9ARCH|nr:pantoate--beta-alanine ligase [Candidatus Diapherotrites archaeon]
MRVIKKLAEMQAFADEQRCSKKKIGFVPTMGFLHEGHLSLVDQAKKKCEVVVVSIYVNPTQFALGEDLDRYPRDFKKDLELCEQRGVDIVFAPDNDVMYPSGFETTIHLNKTTSDLEGSSRPSHFDGVATIVTKLFNAVKPHIAFFGQKDFQQSLIVKRLAKNLNFDLKIEVCPIVREKHGLAMSSRNNYLSTGERSAALVLHKAIELAKEMVEQGKIDVAAIEKELNNFVAKEKLAKVEYIALRNRSNLNKIKVLKKGKTVLLLAVRIGKTRLIDNELL